MPEQDALPLTDDERAELEALRAEKARRERAELEALRAEHLDAAPAPASEPQTAPAPAPKAAPATEPKPAAAPAPAPKPQAAPAPAPSAPAPAPEDRTFGERMVLSEGEDEDGVPTMPPAQKIIIALALVAVVVIVAYFALNG